MNKIEGKVLTMEDTSTYTMARVQDRRHYDEEVEDPTIRTDFEGGYVASRPRHFRDILRRKWKTGFTDVSDADKKQFVQFFNETKGGAIVFEWVEMFDPAFVDTDDPSWVSGSNDALVRKVRFIGPLKPEQKGFGSNLRWNIVFELEEV